MSLRPETTIHAIAALPARWKLHSPELIADTPTSQVWKVRREDGTPAVVKSLTPLGVAAESSSVPLLRWRRGLGAVHLLRRAGAHLLLEYAGDLPLSRVIDTQGDNAATGIAADVLARLAAPGRHPAPRGLVPLGDYFRELFDQAAADRAAGVDSPYITAAQLARRLLDSPHRPCPLHGDLHHDNILCGARGWLAIDPKGLYGDPAFDAANLLYNPLERTELIDEARIAFMAETFAAVLRRTPAAILDYGHAYGCLSAAWHAQDGNRTDEARELSVAALIRQVAAQF